METDIGRGHRWDATQNFRCSDHHAGESQVASRNGRFLHELLNHSVFIRGYNPATAGVWNLIDAEGCGGPPLYMQPQHRCQFGTTEYIGVKNPKELLACDPFSVSAPSTCAAQQLLFFNY